MYLYCWNAHIKFANVRSFPSCCSNVMIAHDLTTSKLMLINLVADSDIVAYGPRSLSTI